MKILPLLLFVLVVISCKNLNKTNETSQKRDSLTILKEFKRRNDSMGNRIQLNYSHDTAEASSKRKGDLFMYNLRKQQIDKDLDRLSNSK